MIFIDHDGIDQEGNKVRIKAGDYVDYEGRYINDPFDPIKGRVPEYDLETRQFKVDMLSYEDFRPIADEYNRYLTKQLGRPLKWREKVWVHPIHEMRSSDYSF